MYSYSLLPLVALSRVTLGNLFLGAIAHRYYSSSEVVYMCDLSSLVGLTLVWLSSVFMVATSSIYFIFTPMESIFISISLIRGGIVILSTISNRLNGSPFEFSTLVLYGVLGLGILLSSNHLILIYLGRELYSYSAMIMANMNHRSGFSTEAGLKFFLVGSFGSVVFLLGSSLAYWDTGSLDINSISVFDSPLPVFLMALSFLIKIAAAPFHWWAPDVYEGAPMSSTFFMVLLPKLMLFGIFLKVISICDPMMSAPLAAVGVLSVSLGMFGAFSQTGIKRFLAYSGIGHMGFMVLGASSMTLNGVSASVLYLILYVIVTLLSWSIVVSIKDSKYLGDLSGLGTSNRGLALGLAFSMFSMAGLPPMAGFFAKMQVLLDSVGYNFLPALIMILVSVVSTFYYLRLVKLMFFESSYGSFSSNSLLAPEVVSICCILLGGFMFLSDPFYVLSLGISECLI